MGPRSDTLRCVVPCCYVSGRWHVWRVKVDGKDTMEAAAFRDHYAASYATLVGQVTALCGNRLEASDAVQEAFVRAWTKRGQFGRVSDKDAWIRTVARRIVIDEWRKRRRSVSLAIDPVFEGPDAAARLTLHRALAQLPDNHRHAVVLHYLVDLPVADIAVELDAKEPTVRVWLSRGRARLEGLMADAKEGHHA